MTHLYIELNTGLTEEVNSSIISKLYELAISGDLDNTSDLKGRLHLTIGYRVPIDYLNTTYPDLYISADEYAIPFEDPNMVTYLNNLGIGSNGMITEALAAAATIVANSENTIVTKFNELKYFTNITTSRGGYTGNTSGVIKFNNWTALEEVDISNFTSIGHNNTYGWEDTFRGCTSLRKVTASDKLTQLGCYAFGGCTNLEYITGLYGNIELHQSAFARCSKLKLSNFDAVYYTQEEADTYNTEHNLTLESEDFKTTSSVKIPGVTFLLTSHSAFYQCSSLTSVALSSLQTNIPENTFCQCGALESVSGLSNVTTVEKESFLQCSSLTTLDIDWSKITTIGNRAFSGCSVLSALDTNDINEDEYTLPASSVGNEAFKDTDLTGKTIIMPNITSISSDLFRNTKISKFVGTNVTSVGSKAFYNCTQLQEVDLGNVTTIGDHPEGVFLKCSNLTTIKFGNLTNDFTNLQSIGQRAFWECGILFASNLSLPNVTYIGKGAFRGHTEIQSITNLGSITSLVDDQFYECSNISSVTLPNTLTKFCLEALSKTALTYVLVPEGVTNAAFGQCVFSSGLFRYAEFPSTVTTMSKGFHRCFEGSGDSGLNTVICVIKATTPPTVTYYNNEVWGSINGAKRLRGIYVPDSALSTYQSASDFWSYSDVQAILKPISQLLTDSPTYWAIYQQGLSN